MSGDPAPGRSASRGLGLRSSLRQLRPRDALGGTLPWSLVGALTLCETEEIRDRKASDGRRLHPGDPAPSPW